jgi:peptidoglycan/LPS O-acetylase OafA/YrhL
MALLPSNFPPPFVTARNTTIDILRFFAVFLVLGRHADYLNISDYGTFISTISQTWRNGGWIGVDLFFVLSGFLVSGLLFREGNQINISRFLVRRGFKIYPAFYVMLATTFVYDYFIAKDMVPNTYYSEIFFGQSYFPHVWPHTWSLAVEEHFYLLLPLLLLVLRRADKNGRYRFLPIVVTVICFVSLVGRIALANSTDIRIAFQEGYFAATHLRIDSLAFGVLLSYFYHFDAGKLDFIKNRKRECLLLSFVLLTPAFWLEITESSFLNTVGHTFLYVSFGLVLIIAINSGRMALFSGSRIGRMLAHMGKHSYSIYLWHFPVKLALEKLFGSLLGNQAGSVVAGSITEMAAYIILSFGVGILMAKLIEFPILRLRDRAFEINSATIPSEATA